MTTLSTAITALISEFEILDGRMTVPARGRRTVAIERVTAAMFSTITQELDPYCMDDLDDVLAGETLAYALLVSDLLVTAMLDFREKAALHGDRPDSHRDRLRDTLLGIWDIALEELMKGPDADEGERGGFAAAA